MPTVTTKTTRTDHASLYDLRTPRWDKYYRAMRKSIKFPRYYKKALNW